MSESELLVGAGSLILSLMGVLLYVVGWVGSRVVHRLDLLADKMDDVKSELHQRINNIDIRVVRLESKAPRNEILG